MNILFDTNVILDVLLEREPYVDTAAMLFALVDNRRIKGYIGGTTVTTIHYIAAKSFGNRKVREELHRLLSLFEVAPIDHSVLDGALKLDFPDYEDAVIHEAARAVGADAIVTRDRRGFSRSVIPALDPVELLAVIAVRDKGKSKTSTHEGGDS